MIDFAISRHQLNNRIISPFLLLQAELMGFTQSWPNPTQAHVDEESHGNLLSHVFERVLPSYIFAGNLEADFWCGSF